MSDCWKFSDLANLLEENNNFHCPKVSNFIFLNEKKFAKNFEVKTLVNLVIFQSKNWQNMIELLRKLFFFKVVFI